jgi:hypothetical protein
MASGVIRTMNIGVPEEIMTRVKMARALFIKN